MPASPPQDWQVVDSRDEIITLLRRLAEARQPVALRHNVRSYLSLLLRLDTDHDQLIFDAPPGGFAALRQQAVLQAQARVQGYGLRFPTTVDALQADGSLVSWMPGSVEHAQRRRTHRVNVPRSVPIRATLFPLGGRPIRVRITDLSTHGFGASLRRESAEELRPGRVLDGAFGLSGTAFYAPITVRAVRQRDDAYALGGEFTALSPGDRRTVEREVVELERYWRPKATNRPALRHA
ncbi:MAG: hypothetical protein CMP06_11735 [Xanthomonadales bacterium]|nr:hypothetical protein [Xanthomonadales bacterium]